MSGIFTGILLFILGLVIFIGFAIGILAFLYALPYNCWLGWNSGRNGVPSSKVRRELKRNKTLTREFWDDAKNATKLYKSWITKKPHGITKF